MKAAIVWLIVLLLTGMTHSEGGHGGLFSIVGDILGNGETGPAVSTVNEGIKVPSISRVHELPHAIPTDGDIRRDRDE